ncbi:MAG: phosphoethanolamine--lipid A transferase [Polaromonas sp.]|nr:phosphoethanolamine--lipid A transferase [Polaromonas sp.]
MRSVSINPFAAVLARRVTAPQTATAVNTSAGGIDPAWLLLGASLWMATAANMPLWNALAEHSLLQGSAGLFTVLAFSLIITSALMLLTSLLAWRWTLKPVLVALLLAAAFGSHFMSAYHVVLDTGMMVNVLQTDLHETMGLLSCHMLLVVTALGLAPAVLVWRVPVNYRRPARRALHNVLVALVATAVLAGTVLASFQMLSSTLRNHHELRYLMNPLNSVYALTNLAAKPLQRDRSMLEPVGQDARAAAIAPGGRPPLLVLVLGETGRSGNFGLNGYPRDTTPELMRLHTELASFNNAWSCGTSTAASVPCMFSPLGKSAFESRKHDYEGLLDVVQHAGMAVLWLDNQSGCKGACDRVPHADSSNLQHPEHCPGGECLDGILLEGLDDRIAALPAERRAKGVVLVLHQMGSHGPAYYQRSPAAFKRFEPECKTNALQACDQTQLVNAYDNSIAYTDHLLASTIGWLKGLQGSYDTAMVYVADHGESLGENNLYLHGMPYLVAPDVQKHVPWITWLSPGFEHRAGLTTACLRGQAGTKLSHDNYFHSVLGLMGIQTSAYQRALDVYAGCAGV